MSDDLIGRRFGNYVVEKLLGAGGMGAVYSAVQPGIGKRVAIKFLAEHLTHHPSLVQRFFAEGRAVNLIQHENIVDIFDFDQTPDGLVYCIMELLSGVSLESELVTHTTLPIDRTIGIITQVADALGAAHAQGILHRDIKPDNIYLVRKKGNSDFVKVLDFGIAKLSNIGDGSTARTASGTIMGTPGYMSPEQGTAGQVDARTDVYALGALLYRMLGGQLPFPGNSFGEILQKQLTESPRPLRELRPEVPEALEGLVHSMLMREPAERPANMGDVARWLSAKPGEAPPPPLPSGLSRTPVVMPAVVRTTLSSAAGEEAPKTQAKPGPRWQLPAGVLAAVVVAVVAWLGLRPAAHPPAAASVTPLAAPPPAAPVAPAPVAAPPVQKFSVKIDSVPAAAEIFDGDVLIGTTPATLSFADERVLKLHRDGFKDVQAAVRRDQPELSVRLTAIPQATHKRAPAAAAPVKKNSEIGLHD
jgi:serine/threonine-protein kinase